MKKVLTLVSALSMVAGSAFANDYDWAGLDSPKTDANHNVVINGKVVKMIDVKKLLAYSTMSHSGFL